MQGLIIVGSSAGWLLVHCYCGVRLTALRGSLWVSVLGAPELERCWYRYRGRREKGCGAKSTKIQRYLVVAGLIVSCVFLTYAFGTAAAGKVTDLGTLIAGVCARAAGAVGSATSAVQTSVSSAVGAVFSRGKEAKILG
ncbi:MAG: hypothetical protein MRJ68_18050 [Nitrospira sp.]|nr:hypothetical protein [Nitrospira sp.]